MPRETKVLGALALYAAAFLLYAVKWAFTWDESYHLVAAQLIAAGKRPYIDFCFPQTPVNAYWNATWMRLLGENWRVPHAFAALFTIGAVLATARFVFVRFPASNWRTAATLIAALLTGLNAMVFIYGPVAQPYGICLFALMIAFLLALRAVNDAGLGRPAAVGFCAGVAAASSLLSAAGALVLIAWILFYNRAGSRWMKLVAYCLAAAIPFAPVLWLFSQGPRQTVFNVIQYHAFFRKLYWPETTSHDFEVLTSWIESGQALLIGLLAVAGLVYIARRSQWPAAMKSEFYLCAWLAAALSLEVSLAHPTFERYFLLAVPFLAILAAVGWYAIASRVLEPDKPLWAVLLVVAILIIELGIALRPAGYRRLELIRTAGEKGRRSDAAQRRAVCRRTDLLPDASRAAARARADIHTQDRLGAGRKRPVPHHPRRGAQTTSAVGNVCHGL
jgi:4-amino-4-deoxy-L-arabinose transferase-like glycosyltransferase